MGATQHTSADFATPGLETVVWLPAPHGSLAPSQCAVWVLLSNRFAMAFALPASCMNQHRWLPWLAECILADPGGQHTSYQHPSGMKAMPLYAAHWSPLQAGPNPPSTVREAAARLVAQLDPDITRLLQGLDTHRIYVSMRNYMRLATLPEPLRTHRMQALVRFPQLCAPVLLTAHQGNTLDGGKRHAWRDHSDEVLAAIDKGRDLTGALAAHWGISRGLVRSPVMRAMWGATGLSHRNLLRLLDGIPAHCRPTDAAALLQLHPLLTWLQGVLREGCHLPTLGRSVFARGLDATWQRLQNRYAEPAMALADTRDFCVAVERVAEDRHPQAAQELCAQGTALAWMQRFGLDDLMAASARWHRQHTRLGPTANADITLPAVFGASTWRTLDVSELLTAQALADEGDAMCHCVASYWDDCRQARCRIFSLRSGDEAATAQYSFQPDALAETGRFQLTQLRGRFNANPSAPVRALAQAFTQVLNAPELAAARQAMARLRLSHRVPDWSAPRPLPLLDASSLAQLDALLAAFTPHENTAVAQLWAAETPPPCIQVTEIRGFQYHEGGHVVHLLHMGETVELVREPHNPHDALAVQVQWGGVQLGYVARPDNEPVAHALDAGQPVKAWIVQLPPDIPDWDNPILIAIDTTPDVI